MLPLNPFISFKVLLLYGPNRFAKNKLNRKLKSSFDKKYDSLGATLKKIRLLLLELIHYTKYPLSLVLLAVNFLHLQIFPSAYMMRLAHLRA